MKNILELADTTGQQLFESPDCTDGWQTPLQKALHRSIGRRSPDVAASSTQIVDTFVAAMDPVRVHGKAAPTIFADLERRDTSSYFDTSDQAGAIQRISSFAVASNIPSSEYLREFKLLVSSTAGTGRHNGPSDAICQTYVRNSITQQFPSLVLSLFPGTLAHKKVLSASVDAM